AARGGGPAAVRERLDGADRPGADRLGELDREQPDRAAADDGDRVADAAVGEVPGVQRDAEGLEHRAVGSRHALGQRVQQVGGPGDQLGHAAVERAVAGELDVHAEVAVPRLAHLAAAARDRGVDGDGHAVEVARGAHAGELVPRHGRAGQRRVADAALAEPVQVRPAQPDVGDPHQRVPLGDVGVGGLLDPDVTHTVQHRDAHGPMLAFTSCDVTPPFRCSDGLCQTRRMDHRELFHEAMQGTDAHVRTVTDADLSRATPCEGWTVADLLAHMIGQQDGWAAAVTDGDAPPSAYAPVPFTQAAWRASADRLLHAFDGADLAATVVVRELTPRPLPARGCSAPSCSTPPSTGGTSHVRSDATTRRRSRSWPRSPRWQGRSRTTRAASPRASSRAPSATAPPTCRPGRACWPTSVVPRAGSRRPEPAQ